jgi:hypothetical protein
MPKQKKAARGKHRWIGFQVEGIVSRSNISQILSKSVGKYEWKLFDVMEQNDTTLAILKTPLDNYHNVLDEINTNDDMSTITSSGKIRLVRQRLNSTIGKDPSNAV